MRRFRAVSVVLGLSAAAVLVSRHDRRVGGGAHDVPGGTIMGDPALYDIVSRLLLGSLFERIADDGGISPISRRAPRSLMGAHRHLRWPRRLTALSTSRSFRMGLELHGARVVVDRLADGSSSLEHRSESARGRGKDGAREDGQ